MRKFSFKEKAEKAKQEKAKLDKEKAEQARKDKIEQDKREKLEQQKREMEQATQGTGVSVVQTSDNQLKLDIPSDISFDTGRSDIKGNFAPILERFAEGLRNNPNTDVRIVGHTDNTGSDAINNPLSMDRAASTRNYLTARGVDGRRIVIEGMGERYPIATNDTAEGRARNRRVEIFVGERPRG